MTAMRAGAHRDPTIPLPHDLVLDDDDGRRRPAWATADELTRAYHDTEWRRPVRDERGLFEVLSLLVFQTGLAWSTVLRRREGLRALFAAFDPARVAALSDREVDGICADPRGIRNPRKVAAVVTNARAALALSDGLSGLVWAFDDVGVIDVTTRVSPASTELAAALHRHGFTIVGPVLCHALLVAVGVLRIDEHHHALEQGKRAHR